ncbi:MAG: hypothetical protein AB8B85_21940 [Paracoccaceae bacterium]
MRCSIILTTCLAVSTATAALADTKVTVGIKGYNDFFKRCDIGFDKKTTSSRASVIFRVLAGSKGGAVCEVEDSSSGCRDSDDFTATCDDVTAVDVLHVKCMDADRTPVSCGKVSIKARPGMSAPVTSLPTPASAEGTVLLGGLLGAPNFSGGCALGLAYAAAPAIKQVKVEYDVFAGAKTDQCKMNLGGKGGTGLSCSGGGDYSCSAVTKVNITKVTCEDSDDVVDCGPVTISGADPGVFFDAR